MVAVSEVTGSLSVAGCLVAGFYQLYLGYAFEGADGFQPLLLLCWLIGDLFNVIGTRWTHQLAFQQLIAVCSMASTLLMTAQHFYYRRKHRRATHAPELLRVDRGKFLATRWNALLRPYILFTLVSAARAQSDHHQNESEYFKVFVGQCMAWIAELSYACALIPQAVENFSRKTTGSVSLIIFVADAMSSLNYLATILANAVDLPNTAEKTAFLLEELPYLFGNTTVCLLDFVLLSQYYLYPQFIVQIQFAESEEQITGCFQPTETTSLQPVLSWKLYDPPV